MSSISTIALSGMNAAGRRLQVTASNIANVGSNGALPSANGTVPVGAPQAYVPLDVVQTASTDGGTQTSVATATPSYVATSDPSASFANQDGLVAAPNVDLAQQFVSTLVAKYSFAANAKVMQAADGMTQSLLNITA
ncbi:flagellar basal body rod protein FlgC [Bradyrhizobium sp.]|uniref:flagellar basal body rod protein FlgC n=1 Tax=Bradyrhizobium sp. TaxID=376 RepID=UPI003C44B5A2